MDIYIYHPWSILGVYKLVSPMSHLTIHCSHTNTMAGKGSSSSTRRKKVKAKQKRLLNKQNQRCPGCLKKSCPKKFNNNEDKCGES